LTAAARIAAYRSYRDKVSRDYMKRVGINVVKDLVYPDLVFNLPHPRSTVPESVKTARKPTTVGLGVMTYYGWRFNEILSKTLYETYIGKLTRFVQWLLKHEYNVRLLIGEDSDHKAANDLLKNIQTDLGMGTKYGITYEPARTIYDVLRQVSETDIVVASRFHNIVCALMLNKPVLSLSYAEKNDALMAEMGLAEYCQHIEKFDVELLVKQFEEVVRNSSRIAQGICEKNREYRKSLDRQFDEIFARLNPNVAQKRIWADKKAS
jgi:polysaccharide pyruvyl transferase WcaK-like protein